jgi:glycosyltransferase involved in cell wall biosynthesis
MRVLFVNSREDAQQFPGGDTIQISKTKAALEEVGLTIDILDPKKLDNISKYDVAHIFNIQSPESTWAVFQLLQKKGIPIVLSPIYWEMYEYWFELASNEVMRWKLISNLLGKSIGRYLYLQWQHKKAHFNNLWQLQRRLLGEASRILPNSQSETVHLQKTYSLNNTFLNKVDVVPNGIDPGLYKSIPEPSQSFLHDYGIRDFILEVGTIYPVKNQLGVIEALFELPIPLVFIGQFKSTHLEDYADQCRARAKERGNVVFIDNVPHEELPGIYALAAIHIMPSWRETPGLVSLEAAVSNCRVVTTSIGSTRDYFGDLAWYCYPNDHGSIRRAVTDALKQPKSETLRNRILSNFTWQQAAMATFKSYEKALG